MKSFTQQRLLIFLSLLVLVPLGLWSKFYSGPGHLWFNHYAGGILYEIFWCLFFSWFFPRKEKMTPITLWVFGGTCGLEFLQLWKPPILQWIRMTLIGRLLLGTTFVGWDFLYYGIGCLIGWFWLWKIWTFSHPEQSS